MMVAQSVSADTVRSIKSEVAIMSDWALLESVEGLEGSSSAQPGALWEFLQGEKERVCSEISSGGSLTHDNGFAANERDPSDEYIEVIDWRHRGALEHQLRDIIDAQDRLIDGSYGQCAECSGEIGVKRLRANPAVSLCLSCQARAETEFAHQSI
jgi:RNA polymerase-binding transcription factor DksA